MLLLRVTATELDPFEAVYRNYRPDFVVRFAEEQKGRNAVPADKLKLSTETTFYTLTLLPEVVRANSLVEAAMKKEEEGQFREALEIYQKVLDEYPDALYRVSASGVFVPITLYCQLRLLRFPAPALQLYRTRHDARAKEAYESALERNSVEGLAEIRDTMLATSFGAKAVQVLGDAALDRGNHLEALEYYRMLRQFFPDSGLRNTEVELKEALCRKLLGEENEPRLKPTDESNVIQALHQLLSTARYELRQAAEQYASASAVAADDYVHFSPTSDPLALDAPVWQHPLPGSRLEFYVFTQPVAAGESIIYRHKNIVYCRSIITGELRWKNDLGGRVTWQNRDARQYPHEDLLVHEGLVFTPMYKVGPTLVALDLVTGQLRWAYGPMTASSEEEARLRFECAPAAGPRSIYASYIQDNIVGDTHVDSEYGVMAFDTTTGQVLWRREVCRLRPEKFAGGFAVRYRNRIRSFASPPLYSEGTVYYCSNAGAIAALDALSGRIKWCIRYPYYAYPHSVHDATRQFGGLEMYENNPLRHHRPMFWYAQRPLLAGEDLYVLPVDSPLFFSIDRRTGKVRWSRYKQDDGSTYFMGLAKSGELILVNSFRRGRRRALGGPYNGGNRLGFGRSAGTHGASGNELLL
ncbi:MAG: outer membrane protein assembly factor BamB family protein [Kiritimatiellia bacterium]